MSAELVMEYRRRALHHARLAERFALALVLGVPDAREEIVIELRAHSRQRDRYRQQADALDPNPNLLVRPKNLAWLD